MGFGLKMTGHPKATIDAKVAEASRVLKARRLSRAQAQGAIGAVNARGWPSGGPSCAVRGVPVRRAPVEPRCRTARGDAGRDRPPAPGKKKFRRHDDLASAHDQVESDDAGRQDPWGGVLRAGRVEQVGEPLDLYNDPDNRFVAGFIGSPAMNFFDGRIEGGHVAVPALDEDADRGTRQRILAGRGHGGAAAQTTCGWRRARPTSVDLSERLGGRPATIT